MTRTHAFPLLAPCLLIAVHLVAVSGCSSPGSGSGTEGTSSSAVRPEASGAYLGQSPPGLTPEVFAPGIVSRVDTSDGCSAVSPEAGVFLFNRYMPDTPYSLYLTELRDGAWIEPAPAPFNSEYDDWDSNIAPDGRTFYFTSRRPSIIGGQPATSSNIWVANLTSTGWTEPRVLEYPVNTVDGWSGHPSVTRNGTIYFHGGREGEEGDIYRARRVDGEYPELERLDAPVNSALGDIDPCIAPDEGFLVYLSGEPRDLHITFRSEDGSWDQPTRLPEDLSGACPTITPDGRYFFFTKRVDENVDIFWVDAEVLQQFRPEAQSRR